MAYWIDRTRAFRGTEIVVALNAHQRGMRIRAVLADGSLYDTRTRPRTFVRAARQGLTQYEGVVWPSARTNPR